MKTYVLFLCTGNSCRSQMAEGWARHLLGEIVKVYSAGIEAHGLNPFAIRVMAEVGVDISKQRSKVVGELKNIAFDYVVTVCDNAKESCPIFLGGGQKLHKNFEDPAKFQGNEDERMAVFRRVRDEIKAFVERLPEMIDLNKKR